MTADEIILFPKQLYVKEQAHGARVLHDHNFKHKNGQLSYLNRLSTLVPPQTSKITATNEIVTEKAEPKQEQLKLLSNEEEVPAECDTDEKSQEKKR